MCFPFTIHHPARAGNLRNNINEDPDNWGHGYANIMGLSPIIGYSGNGECGCLGFDARS